MASIFSVSKVNSYIKHMFEEDFALNSLSVKGEISGCKYHSTGHVYFTLKDENSAISCIMFASNAKSLKFKLIDGMQIVCKGKVSVYEKSGTYQLYVQSATMDGEGDLHKRFLKLKAELEEMGMFDKSYKKPIPKYCLNIGVVTAKTGAAIRDIMNITSRRNPHVNLYLYNAIVQGDEAKYSICDGIAKLDELNLDVIIVGRGGGSVEDLWAFNEEMVARAIFSCNTPVISAVGHEIDYTISDMVADLRAPTPSAAAEIAVFDYNDYIMELAGYNETITKEMQNKIMYIKNILMQKQNTLVKYSPMNRITKLKGDCESRSIKLKKVMDEKLNENKHRYMLSLQKLEGLSPINRLKEGYAYISTAGKVLKSVDKINVGEQVCIDLIDGSFDATINNIEHKKRS